MSLWTYHHHLVSLVILVITSIKTFLLQPNHITNIIDINKKEKERGRGRKNRGRTRLNEKDTAMKSKREGEGENIEGELG